MPGCWLGYGLGQLQRHGYKKNVVDSRTLGATSLRQSYVSSALQTMFEFGMLLLTIVSIIIALTKKK